MLSSTEIAGMQDCAENALPDSGAITRKTLTSDGMGGFTTAWATSSTVDCRIEAASRMTPQERLMAERVAPRVVVRITVPHDADVIAADRIVISGTTYEVLAPLPGATWMLTKKALAVVA